MTHGPINTRLTIHRMNLCSAQIYLYLRRGFPSGYSGSCFTHQREIKRINIMTLRFLSREPPPISGFLIFVSKHFIGFLSEVSNPIKTCLNIGRLKKFGNVFHPVLPDIRKTVFFRYYVKAF